MDEFSTRGIQSLLLKGPSIARWLYTDGTVRSYIDTDVLVPPDRLEAAQQALVELGYVDPRGALLPTDRSTHDQGWWTDHHKLDLHNTIWGVGVPAAHLWPILWASAQKMVVGGSEIAVLGLEARLVHVVLHAAAHAGVGHTLTDLQRALEYVALSQWRTAADLARELDALPAFAAGLGTCPAGKRMLGILNPDAGRTMQVELRADGIPVPLSLGFEWLFAAGDLSQKMRYLRWKVFPTKRFLQTWSPLARRGSWGLTLAYLWRPLWLLARAPSGLAAWMKAKRRVTEATRRAPNRSKDS